MEALIAMFLSISDDLRLPPGLLSAVCYVESKYDVNAVHHDDGGESSLGVCQIKESTARWLGFKGTKKQLMNPTTNAYWAARYLKYNIERYDGRVRKAVIAYNRGNATGLYETAYSRAVFKRFEYIRTTTLAEKE